MNTVPVNLVVPLPFCLHLRDGNYKIRCNERIYFCHLRKVWSDFASGCNPDKHMGPIESEFLFQVTTGKITKASNVEIKFDKKGFFRHTIFSTTIYLDENLKAEEIRNRTIRAALPLINKLLVAYRYATKEFHITEVQWSDFCLVRDGKIMPFLTMDYATQGQQRKRIMGWFAGDESPLRTMKTNVSKQEHKAIEKTLLEKDPQVPLERDLVLNAKDYSRQGRYSLAIFELGTALEIAINNILLSKSVSEKELRNLSFKDKYGKMLRQKTKISLKNSKPLLFTDVLKIWNIRNNVAHKRVTAFTDKKGNVIEKIESKDQMEPLVRSTEQTIDYLSTIH